MSAPLSPADFAAATGVSRETLDGLRRYADLLAKWQTRINLVGAATLADPWRRHFLDSAQLFRLLPPGARRLVDLGSGAGFPGLVLAILGVPEVHLIESDSRKCAFLREAARVAGAAVGIHNCRIEAAPPLGADIVTARALAPLSELLGHARRMLAPGGQCLFLKGRGVDGELTEASKDWKMAVERIASLSDESGVILRIQGVAARGPA